MTSALFRYPESREAMVHAYERLLEDTPQARPHTVSTRSGETHMLVAGPEGAPPLLVLHGAMGCSALAIREAHPLFAHFRVYALDVLGQSSKSADVRLRMDSLDYVEWVQDVLDALELPKAHIYGASLGGFIGRRLAEVAPERIDRLVLLVPAGIVSGPVLQGISKAGIPLALFRMMGSQAALERFIDSMLTAPDKELFSYLAQALTHCKLDMGLPPMATPEPLATFRRPTLVLGGENDLTAPGQALLDRARELFPHASLELLPNTKHVPATDPASRERLCARVSQFLLQ